MNLVTNVSAVGFLAVNPLGAATDSDTVTFLGNSSNNVITVQRITNTTSTPAGLQPVLVNSANTEALVVSGRLGDDSITVSGTGGPALTIDGGGQTSGDTLILDNTTAGLTTVTAGDTADAGTITTPDIALQTAFVGIKAITLQSAAATDDLRIVATNGADAISAAARSVAVNSAVVSFAGFDHLELQALAGADAITVAPMVGVSVLVNGGDPANSDTLEVNGTTAANDITVSPTGRDSGTVQVDTLGLVTFNTVEALTVNGLGGDDTLEYRTPAGRDLIQHQRGRRLATVRSMRRGCSAQRTCQFRI